MSWTQDYLRLRFAMGGRVRPAVDCWGLYRLIIGERAGLWLDEFGGNESRFAIARTMTAEVPGTGWATVTAGEEREFDMVLMRGLVGEGRATASVAMHVGCVVAPETMIDIEDVSGVMVRAFRGERARPEMRNRVLGIYRPLGLA